MTDICVPVASVGGILIYAINVREEEYQRALLVSDASIISQISKTVSFQVTVLEINHQKIHFSTEG